LFAVAGGVLTMTSVCISACGSSCPSRRPPPNAALALRSPELSASSFLYDSIASSGLEGSFSQLSCRAIEEGDANIWPECVRALLPWCETDALLKDFLLHFGLNLLGRLFAEQGILKVSEALALSSSDIAMLVPSVGLQRRLVDAFERLRYAQQYVADPSQDPRNSPEPPVRLDVGRLRPRRPKPQERSTSDGGAGFFYLARPAAEPQPDSSAAAEPLQHTGEEASLAEDAAGSSSLDDPASTEEAAAEAVAAEDFCKAQQERRSSATPSQPSSGLASPEELLHCRRKQSRRNTRTTF